MKHNPYYNPEKLDLVLESVEEGGLSYEFDILAFWATKDGIIYSASDSGCSCPTPFENYEGETQDDVLKLLERVGSLWQAEAIIDGWNKNYDKKTKISMSERQGLIEWIKANSKI